MGILNGKCCEAETEFNDGETIDDVGVGPCTSGWTLLADEKERTGRRGKPSLS